MNRQSGRDAKWSMRKGLRGSRPRRPLFALAAATIVTSLVLAPSVAAQEQSPSADEPVILRVGTTADLISANPWAVSSGSDWTVATAQYDMLLAFSSEDLSPAPSLATGCEPNDDWTEWTCTLREGLLWSDGTPLTSRDVAFTYRFVIDHKIPQYRSYFTRDATFETPDDRTLIWKSPEPTFAPEMPPYVYIVPEAVWSPHVGKSLREIKAVPNTPTIASGPFTLTEWSEGQGWTMERNEHYWGKEPTVDRVEYRLYSNQESMVQALRNSEVDIIDQLEPSLIASVEGLPNVAVQRTISDWWLNLAFNFGGQGPDADPLPALHDRTVREAVAMAIDKGAIVDKVYQGAATPGDTIIRPASAYWHLDIPADEEIPFDPDGANALLDEAGYVDTDDDRVREDPETGEPLRLRMPASKDTAGAVNAGQLIVGFLKQIGIAVDLLPVNDAKMNDYWGAGNFDAYIWYWYGDPDPNYQLFVFTSDQCGSWSDGCWKDPVFDGLYEEQQATFDRDARRDIVFEAQRRVYEQIPGVVLAYPGSIQAYRTDRFSGWVPHPGEDGYLLPSYNYESLLNVRPVTAAAAQPTAARGIPGWIWVAVAAGIVVGGGTVARLSRRRELHRA